MTLSDTENQYNTAGAWGLKQPLFQLIVYAKIKIDSVLNFSKEIKRVLPGAR